MQMRHSGLDRILSVSLLLTVFLPCFLATGTFSLASAATSATDDWPAFCHDATHSGHTAFPAPSTNQLLWSRPIDGPVFSSSAVVDGRVFVGSNDGKVYCFEAASGVLLWTRQTGGSVRSSPAVADGKVYIGSEDRRIYCLNAASGGMAWSYQTHGIIQSSPAVVENRVYVSSSDGKVYCIDASTGRYITSVATGGPIFSSPAVVNGYVYVGSSDNMVYCFNIAFGVLYWSFPTGGNVYSSPTVVDDKVFVGSNDGKIYCLQAKNGSMVWSYATGDSVRSVPAISNGNIYVGSDDGKIYCLNAKSGAHIWNYTTGGFVTSSPAVADGRVYVGSGDYKIYCLDASNGAPIWTYTTNGAVWASPAAAGGKLYVSSWDGGIYAFGRPTISDFNGLFVPNNVRMIYPSDTTPKPLGCAPAMVSDWTASAFIYTKLENATEGKDTNSTFVDQATGQPLGAAGTTIVSFGGPVVNPVVKYAEADTTPSVDRAPVRFQDGGSGVLFFQYSNRTIIPGAYLLASSVNHNEDMFVIEVYRDGEGRDIMLCYGMGWQGTYAAGKYFDTEIYPNLTSYTYSWIIVKWEDTNANGFVNAAADGDTYTVIAKG